MHRIFRGVLLAAVAFFTTACVVIDDGEVGVSKSFGSISDERARAPWCARSRPGT